jgi:hypothetical protein
MRHQCLSPLQVLTLLAWCNAEAGDAEQALQCLQALRQMGEEAAAAHFSLSYLYLRTLLQLGRCRLGAGLGMRQLMHAPRTVSPRLPLHASYTCHLHAQLLLHELQGWRG